ncbi:MAG TPA: plastocyanin/azurin family copper-binding protein [Acidimicrobiales bacterium]
MTRARTILPAPHRAPARRRASLLGAGLLTALLVLGACGDDGDSSDGADGDAADDAAEQLEDVVDIDGDTAEVKVLDNTFNEENIRVAPGTKVVWTNDGRQDHDIVPVDGDTSDWGVEPEDFESGDVYEHTFDEPGTYRYYCSLHGTEDAGMIGAVVVEE